MTQRLVYTLITPEGREFVIGAFRSAGAAKAAARRKHPADYLSLCCYPLEHAALAEGEKVEPWTRLSPS